MLGKVVEMRDKKPQAYSQAFTIENAPYYFTIALHETFVHMGILVSLLTLGQYIKSGILISTVRI